MYEITINGAGFTPNPECATLYKHDYVKVAASIDAGEVDQLSILRHLILNDLWFVLYFVVKPFSDDAGREKANSPFVVRYAREIEHGPQDYTLDLAARFHFKTSLFIAEMIQNRCKDRNGATGIFSYAMKPAKKILFTIKSILENEKILPACFPEIFWEDPERDAPRWSVDEGIICKRETNRGEASFSAFGLIEGLPTGLHFSERYYDDISTQDTAESMEMMEKIKLKFDSSKNLGTMTGGKHRVIGTFFHHEDPLVYIRRKTKKDSEGNVIPQYHVRFKPATKDGTRDGEPVLMDQEMLDNMKDDKSFNCQQLLNPTPEGQKKLDPDLLKEVNPEFIPQRCYNFLLVDPAGDDATNVRKGDAWNVMLLGVDPQTDDLGASDVYIKNLYLDVLTEAEAVDVICRMFLTGGVISKFGYEKFGNFTPAVASHVLAALAKAGRKVSEELGNFMWLRPAGREKKSKIVNAIHWPLINGKIHISTAIPYAYRERLRQEMRLWPLWHDDGLDGLAYLWDILNDRQMKLLLGRNPAPVKSVSSIMERINLRFGG